MPVLDDLEEAQRCELLKWAVVEHHRTWSLFDGDARRVVEHDGLDPLAVRKIAREYGVNRGILKTKDENGKPIAGKDNSAKWLAEKISHAAGNWPESLQERAEACAEIARNASREGYTRGELASATTKIIWFCRPDGWTLFDRLAANGLGVPTRQSTKRMLRFYTELSTRNFLISANCINEILNDADFGELYGERVIDKFLMLVGADNDWTVQAKDYARTPDGKTIIKTANTISQTVGRNLLERQP